MRRKEKAWADDAEIMELLDRAEWGTLGLVSPDGQPVMVPLNFVRVGDRLYFHGAHSGEKMDILAANGTASFLVVEAFAQIPSYAADPVRACPASQYFRSVLAYGQVTRIDDPERKARALDAVMAKLQPEGGYRPITAADPLYREAVAGVAVLEMTMDRVSGKAELGQRLSPERRAKVVEVLERRGDRRTLAAMGEDPGVPGSAAAAPGAGPAS